MFIKAPAISAVFNAELKFISLFNTIPPIVEDDVLGLTAWAYSPHDEPIIRTSLERCLATGQQVTYRVTASLHGHDLLFIVRAKRFQLGGEYGVHCYCPIVPAAVAKLSASDIAFLLLLADHGQQEVAAMLGLTQPAISHRERAMRIFLGIESRRELIHIAEELAQERRITHGDAL